MSPIMLAPFLLTLALAAPQSSPPITIYVYTAVDASGFVDEDQQQRTDSVLDLRKVLAKRSDLRVVDAPESAVITIEITSRRLTQTGALGTVQDFLNTLKATLRVGEYETELVGTSKPLEGWRKAGKSLSDQIGRWVEKNRAKLTVS